MKKEIDTKLVEILSQTMTDYKGIELLDDNKMRALNILSKEHGLLLGDLLKNEEIRIKQERHEAEVEKIKEQTKLEKAKLNLERRKFDHLKEVEKTKLKLEMRKQEFEMEKFSVETNKGIVISKSEKINRWINIGVKVFEITAPLLIYTLLFKNNLNLIYKDSERVAPGMMDVMRRV